MEYTSLLPMTWKWGGGTGTGGREDNVGPREEAVVHLHIIGVSAVFVLAAAPLVMPMFFVCGALWFDL